MPFILLRAEGYPCVFYADYYGADYVDRGPERQRAQNPYGFATAG